ncbi:ribonuclease P protein component [Helicobacter sp. 13S00477-4]|uniref:ribonuclease P protein component n=1 Tax=Helicobacter sp. 13S00477-4 TaxID=1905759 RepID=UPI000BA50120|nr:ribonuclease P protein component [Helicobacter sp. 13S00477-4]PAF52602.1 ribonuclease P protein component [Helicobacter sp. 13S00477-4]
MDSLKNKKEFDFVYKKGNKRYAKNFTLYLLPFCSKTSFPFFREFGNDIFLLGLSVSKKNGKAVQRNFIKRRIRFLCRSHLEKLRNYALIFVVKQGMLELSYKQLEEDFLKCLKGLSQRERF